MSDDAMKAIRSQVREAEERFRRKSDAASDARRRAFAEAQKNGLSLRQIGEEVGLHRSRVAQIIKGE